MMTVNLPQLQSMENQALAELKQRLLEQFSGVIQSILLYGSKARGDSTPDSDVDVLIVVDSDDWRLHKQICYVVADVGLQYDLNLSPRIWSISHLCEMQAMNASLYQNICRDGINLLQLEPA
jgi:predicted nucleotidyltransferase